MSNHSHVHLSSSEQISDAAEHLHKSHHNAQATSPVRHLLEAHDIAGAYEVQNILNERSRQNGRHLSGFKAGLTSIAAQQVAKTNMPMSGLLFSDMEVPDGSGLSSSRLIAPHVEAEVAFVMCHDLDDPQVSFSRVMRAVDFVLPAIEIVDTRIADWDVHAVDLIADQAGSAHYILGTRPVSLSQVDLKLCGMTLEINGDPVSFGVGMANMGHPLHALAWIARQLAERKQPLRAGDVVLSGALAPMTAVQAGQAVHVMIQGLGEVGFYLESKNN